MELCIAILLIAATWTIIANDELRYKLATKLIENLLGVLDILGH